MIGNIQEATWRTIAADIDGVPQPEKIGTRTHELRAYFAYKSEAETWLIEQKAAGYTGTIGMAAISYFGPTDSPSNCWSVQVERELPQTFTEHTAAMIAATEQASRPAPDADTALEILARITTPEDRRMALNDLPVKVLREMADLCGVGDSDTLSKKQAITAITENF